MKTYKKTEITKKEIQKIIRTEDPTQIFRLYHRIHGGKVEKHQIFDFVRKFAPTEKIRRNALRIAYPAKIEGNDVYLLQRKREIEFKNKNILHYAMDLFRKNIKRIGKDNYVKRPIIIGRMLCFAHPIYKALDYNRFSVMPIEGNEKFVKKLIELSNYYFKDYEKNN